ncbi:serine-type D-Ala-D-Ala carboxypeptidase [Vibrio porteresiae]|uniref:Beta-lactamase n=1 Tax=Vibrio porteresiae DSM 19223 TaxID=1123496 RepID=A0ABZ0QB38_9VIBR|nr:serine-type D-Ala-D-Ala carboxypeptidase [Vibrio porteresiae]WPC73646.1 serine-type D-Ala-D-Ala carboxypeptidase [Vibrio porteresiae DSM 19223]
MRYLFLWSALLWTTICGAAPLVPALPTLTPDTRYAFSAQSLSDENQHYEQATGQYFPPASTFKLVTALAAKLELGDEFRFSTSLRRQGNDYIIQFSGDPTLTTDDLKQLLRTLPAQGTKRIRGHIWLDNQVFSGFEKAVGWPWDSLGVCYSAPSSAINLDHNCAPASLTDLNNGQTRLYVPEQYPIHVMNQAKVLSKEEVKQQHCELELTAAENNHYVLSGCMEQRSTPLPLKFAVQNTGLYAKRMVYKALHQLGIQLDGDIHIGPPTYNVNQAQILAKHQSEALPELLDTMLKKSDNLIADTLTKTMGHHYFQQPGSYSNGTNAIKAILANKAGISLESAQLYDGSGLSRNNRIHVNTMQQVLRYVWRHDSELHLIELLPRSGESGTLQYRRSMLSNDIKGLLTGKSGSLYGTHNMIGYLLDSNGQPTMLFTQYITDYFPPENEEELNSSPLTDLEQQFYRQLITLNQAHDSQH